MANHFSSIDWEQEITEIFPELYAYCLQQDEARSLSPRKTNSRRPTNAENFETAFEIIHDADKSGSIYNVDLQLAKDILNKMFEGYFDKIREDARKHPYYLSIVQSKHTSTSEPMMWTFVHGVADVRSVKKSLIASRKDPLIQEDYLVPFENFAQEAGVIYDAFKEMKPAIIKGRKPNPNPKPVEENPEQVRGTCSCCMGNVACITNGETPVSMAHHGYQRPGQGWQTSSCFGKAYPPLEFSNAGIEALIYHTTASIEKSQETLDNADSIQSLYVEPKPGQKATTIEKGEKGWDDALRAHIRKTQGRLDRAVVNLGIFQQRLASWTPGVLKKMNGEVFYDPEKPASPTQRQSAPAP